MSPEAANNPGPSHRLRHCAALALLSLCLFSTSTWSYTGEHYELSLRPDFDQRILHGHARIRLDVRSDPGPVLELPSPALEVARVRLNGDDVPFSRHANGWRIALARAPAGAAPLWLEIDYLAPASEGLVFGEQHVYTAFHTCQWMPCVGTDLSRASLAISLDLPDGYRSVASGERVADAGTGQRWVENRPYALYTLGFAAGLFTEVIDIAGNPPLRYLGVNEDAAALRAKFKDSAQMLTFFERKAGLPLPHPVYTQVLLPGGVAQEASGFALIGKRALDPILEDPQEDWVIAHEMAHQWWGNLITCATWNELWLNEGVTVFMTAAWKQHRWGEAAYQRELGLARERWQRARESGYDKPLGWSGTYPNLSTRRAIQYSKGALFLSTLREELGEDTFWDGLRRYSRTNAGRSVSASDLQSAMESSAGRTLKPLFDAWVY